MTRPLLAWLAQLHVPLLVCVAAAAVVGLLLPLAVVVDVAGALAWRRQVGRALSAREARCPLGHAVSLPGDWECACGFRYRGHAWADCPACGSRPHAIRCPCGLSVVSPLPPREGG